MPLKVAEMLAPARPPVNVAAASGVAEDAFFQMIAAYARDTRLSYPIRSAVEMY
jgi:hypothetical protein